MLVVRSLSLAVCVTLGALVCGCSKETPPAAEEPRSASNAAVSPAAPASAGSAVAVEPASAASDKVTDTSFELALAPKEALKAGQAGSVEVVLVAKPPFHVNDKYPIKLKLKETEGVRYSSLTVGKDSAKVEAERAVLPVAFTPERAGTFTVAGVFAFSVCTEDKCLMEKRDLALQVNVD